MSIAEITKPDLIFYAYLIIHVSRQIWFLKRPKKWRNTG